MDRKAPTLGFTLLLFAAVVAAADASTPSSSTAAQSRASDLFSANHGYPSLTVGLVSGSQSDPDLDIPELRLSYGAYARNGVGFYVEGIGMAPRGTHDGDPVGDAASLGGGFFVRWHFLRNGGRTFYTDFGSAVLWSLDRFPPGGTPINGTQFFGLGLSQRIAGDWSILLGARQVHISNGRGLVESNPAFDGFGFYAGFTTRPRRERAWPPRRTSVTPDASPLRLRAETRLQEFGDRGEPGASVTMDWRPLERSAWVVQGSVSLVEVQTSRLWDFGGALYHEGNATRLALGYRRQTLGGLRSHHVGVHVEHWLQDVVDVESFVSVEDKNLDEDRMTASFTMAIYPFESLALRSGFGFDRPLAGTFDSWESFEDGGWSFGGEWAPRVAAKHGISMFGDVGIGSSLKVVGLRLRSNATPNLREMRRTAGMVLLR